MQKATVKPFPESQPEHSMDWDQGDAPSKSSSLELQCEDEFWLALSSKCSLQIHQSLWPSTSLDDPQSCRGRASVITVVNKYHLIQSCHKGVTLVLMPYFSSFRTDSGKAKNSPQLGCSVLWPFQPVDAISRPIIMLNMFVIEYLQAQHQAE